MKKASYKKYMKPFSYQQPGSPNTKDTCHLPMAKAMPGFSSYQLNLTTPFVTTSLHKLGRYAM